MKILKKFLLVCLISICFIPKSYAITPTVSGVRFRYGSRNLNGTNIINSEFQNFPKMIWSNVGYPYMVQSIFVVKTNSTESNVINFDSYNQYYVYLSLPGSWIKSDYTCNDFKYELIFYNENTENFDYFNNSISCSDVKFRKNFYNQDGYSYNAYNFILQINVPSDFGANYKVGRISILSKIAAFIDQSPYQIGMSYFKIDTDYDEKFLNISNELLQEQIKKQQETNNKLDDVKDKINDTNETIKNNDVSGANSEASSFFNNFSTTNHGGISSIVSAPLISINAMLNGTCTPLTATYKNKTIELPCGTEFWERLSSVKTFLNVIEGGLICYGIITKLYKDIERLKNPDDDRVDVMKL